MFLLRHLSGQLCSAGAARSGLQRARTLRRWRALKRWSAMGEAKRPAPSGELDIGGRLPRRLLTSEFRSEVLVPALTQSAFPPLQRYTPVHD